MIENAGEILSDRLRISQFAGRRLADKLGLSATSDVPYVPGPQPWPGAPLYLPRDRVYWSASAHSVVNEDQSLRIPRADTPNRSQRVTTGWGGRGILAVIAVLALAVIADGAFLMFLAWLTR